LQLSEYYSAPKDASSTSALNAAPSALWDPNWADELLGLGTLKHQSSTTNTATLHQEIDLYLSSGLEKTNDQIKWWEVRITLFRPYHYNLCKPACFSRTTNTDFPQFSDLL
jgi:hypothetical protein